MTRERLLEICERGGWVPGIARKASSLRLAQFPPTRLAEVGRRYYGGSGTGEAINRHSERLYVADNTLLFFLDRNLDLCPPCYELRVVPGWFEGVVPVLPVRCRGAWGFLPVERRELWGCGESWSRAVRRMCEALRVELVLPEALLDRLSPEDIEGLKRYAAAGK